MKICPTCQTENENDAFYCKRCANSFFEEERNQGKKKNNKQRIKKQKEVKTKTKYKTRVKKEKFSGGKQKSNSFSKFLVFILLIIVILLSFILGVFIYDYYQENNIKVPDVSGYSYEEATAILHEANLDYRQKEKYTTNEDEVGNVINQSKRAGSKTYKNSVITLTVGVLDIRVEVPDVRGLTLEEAAVTLNQAGIFYQVVYEESFEDASVVLKQSVKAGRLIDATKSIILTVSIAKNNDDDSILENSSNSTDKEENIAIENNDTLS